MKTAFFGDNDEFEIYYDGSGRIQNNVGQVRIAASSSVLIYQDGPSGTRDFMKFLTGRTEIYADNTLRFVCNESGSIASGILTATNFSGDGSET